MAFSMSSTLIFKARVRIKGISGAGVSFVFSSAKVFASKHEKASDKIKIKQADCFMSPPFSVRIRQGF
jgi:hypothetical protein